MTSEPHAPWLEGPRCIQLKAGVVCLNPMTLRPPLPAGMDRLWCDACGSTRVGTQEELESAERAEKAWEDRQRSLLDAQLAQVSCGEVRAVNGQRRQAMSMTVGWVHTAPSGEWTRADAIRFSEWLASPLLKQHLGETQE